MSRVPRDRDADRIAISAAIERLLAGTPLHSVSGKLTGSELITESGLRRDVVYGHKDLVVQFKARVKAQDSVPIVVESIRAENRALKDQVASLKADLAAERQRGSALAKLVAELSLELDQTAAELAEVYAVTRLPIRGRRAPDGL